MDSFLKDARAHVQDVYIWLSISKWYYLVCLFIGWLVCWWILWQSVKPQFFKLSALTFMWCWRWTRLSSNEWNLCRYSPPPHTTLTYSEVLSQLVLGLDSRATRSFPFLSSENSKMNKPEQTSIVTSAERHQTAWDYAYLLSNVAATGCQILGNSMSTNLTWCLKGATQY